MAWQAHKQARKCHCIAGQSYIATTDCHALRLVLTPVRPCRHVTYAGAASGNAVATCLGSCTALLPVGSCFNRSCVRPEHLTDVDNMQRSAATPVQCGMHWNIEKAWTDDGPGLVLQLMRPDQT